MLTLTDVQGIVSRLSREVTGPDKVPGWAEGIGVDIEAFSDVVAIGCSRIATDVDTDAVRAEADDDSAPEMAEQSQALVAIITQLLMLGVEMGATIVSDAAMPSLDNLTDEPIH